MKFRTEYTAEKSKFSLDPSKPVVLAGSCFSQNIAAMMTQHGWEGLNLSGTLYNPVSIFNALDMFLDASNGRNRFEDSLFEDKGIWSSWWFDSSFSSLRKEDCVEEFLLRQKKFHEALSQGNTLLITLGTSICYYTEADENPVGNCHKQPSAMFFRRRLEIDEILEKWKPLHEKLQRDFPGIHIVFTVSPVRHLKDGFSGNARSKAVLMLAIEKICDSYDDCIYFPAFEILNDDLRDYRFYASDLLHPSDEGIEYIWQKFIDTFLDKDGIRLLAEGAAKFKSLNHRPKTGALGHPLAPLYQEGLKNLF